MSDSHDVEYRDALPALALETLAPSTAARVQAHLEGCAACREELALLRVARESAEARTPVVDVGRIVAALPAPPSAPRSVPSLHRTQPVRTRSWWASRPVLAAAASVVLMLGVALPVAREAWQAPAAGQMPETGSTSVVAPATPGGVAVPVEGGLESLSDADLSALLGVLEVLEATPVAEPVAIGAPIVDAPEVL